MKTMNTVTRKVALGGLAALAFGSLGLVVAGSARAARPAPEPGQGVRIHYYVIAARSGRPVPILDGQGTRYNGGFVSQTDRVQRGERLGIEIVGGQPGACYTLSVRADNGFRQSQPSTLPFFWFRGLSVSRDPSFDNVTVTVTGPNGRVVAERRLPIGTRGFTIND
jgi:hypothetical protein